MVYFASLQVDSAAVNIFDEHHYSHLGLTAMGHREKLKRFCDESEPGESSTSSSADIETNCPEQIKNRRERLLELIRRKGTSKPARPGPTRGSPVTAGRPKQTSRVISIGMRLLSERKRDAKGARIAVTVKSPLGDKNVVAIEFDLDANYDQMLCKITATLLKNGVNSVAGKAAEYLLEMANGRNENVRSAITGYFTLANYLEEKHIPGAIRLYLGQLPRREAHSRGDTAVPWPTT